MIGQELENRSKIKATRCDWLAREALICSCSLASLILAT